MQQALSPAVEAQRCTKAGASSTQTSVSGESSKKAVVASIATITAAAARYHLPETDGPGFFVVYFL